MTNRQRNILTIQGIKFLKEVDVSDETPVIKIGTLQDCDVRLKRDLFDIPVYIVLKREDNGWSLSCNDEACFSSATLVGCRETQIRHGDIISFDNATGSSKIMTLSFSHDFTTHAADFDTIIDIRGMHQVTIGNSPEYNIQLGSPFAGSEYLVLTRGNSGRLELNALHAQRSATLNGVRVLGRAEVGVEVEVREYDFIGIADYSFYYKNEVLYTNMREGLQINGIRSHPIREETPAFDYPKLNLSPRLIYDFNKEPIEILVPPKKPEKPKDNLLMTLMPMLLMAIVIVVLRSGIFFEGFGGTSMLIFGLSSMAVGAFTSLGTFFYSKKRYKTDLAEWHSDYKNYIAKKRAEIEQEQRVEIAALNDVYPPSNELRDFVKTFSGRLFERSCNDTDFLHVRAGLGSVPALREVTSKSEEKVKTDNELMEIPEILCNEYRYVHNAPVMFHLREAGNVGVIGTPDRQYEFFKNMLLDICILHHYDDVKVVVFIPENDRPKYEWIKWLPHIKDSGGDARGIVCDSESRDNMLEYLYSFMADRTEYVEANKKIVPLPYYVVFVLDEHGIKTHPVSNFSENCASIGFTFIYFKEYMESLPRYCIEIAELSANGGVQRMRNDKAYRCAFVSEPITDESIQFVTERLAPVFIEKIALSSKLTTNVTLFELLNIITPEDLNLIDRWKKSNIKKSLAAPLGVNVKGEWQVLDLHEKAHGPHGLVAGTTGSGKSEIMQSYILSAAVNFHPYEIGFVIIDFKGGGMANQFEDLPHLIGKITDIDNHEINRSLLSIRAELDKRKRLFSEFEVNHIDDYMAKYQSGVAGTPLPHLIIIVDEFAELKAEQPEFMKELISTARVGRSLGIHLILATQKPAGQVNEQIWSNSKFKLCLKVATKEDSNEVLKSSVAAEIREPGRAYLQVGNNEIFTLFQSAYSGASAVSDNSGNIREFKISEVSFTGKRTVVHERKAERTAEGEKITQLSAMVDYINSYCREKGISRLPSICPPPLSDCLNYIEDRGAQALRIGIYDDPVNQAQPEVTLNLSTGNIAIIGAPQTGKTMLLQTIIRGIAASGSPGHTSIYILDFASKVLKLYEALGHVGGVMTDSEDEKLKNFFKMMNEEIARRKDVFSQMAVSSYDAYIETVRGQGGTLPRIVVMVDNLSLFKELYEVYEDVMLNICREGLSVGVTVIVTAKQTSGLSYRYMSSFSTRIALNCTESSEYGSLFDRCRMEPRDTPGRGLVSIDKIVYEFQTFLAFDGDTESSRNEQARAFVAETNNRYGNEKARPIPSIPVVLTEDYWSHGYTFGDYVVPVGLSYDAIEPVTVDICKVGAVGIYGREGFGKSNLVSIFMYYLRKHVFDLPSQVYIIDGYDRQMAKFENFGMVERYTVDCAEFEDIIQTFSDTCDLRMDKLRNGESLDSEPLMLCIVQNSQIFAPDVVPRAVSDKFKRILNDARALKMTFIFANVDNTSEYSAPDIHKAAREFSPFFLFDDINNVKVISSKFSAAELREFKKNIALGDGYMYDSREGVQKVKFVKCKES